MKRYTLFFFLLLFVLVPVFPVQAFEFNPNNIITDFELKDKNSMSLGAIQAFLNKHDSPIKNLTFDLNGQQRTAAEIIYQIAQEQNISPKFILTKIDHEQCLVRGCSFHNDPTKFQKALDWATGFAVCSGCRLDDPRLQKYKGFVKQVDAVASVQNDYIRKSDKPHIYARGQTFTTRDGKSITPKNQATANLYTYTPYQGGTARIGGNFFFAKLWDQYWGRQLYPDGTVLNDENNQYWLVDGGMKRRYASVGVFLSSHVPEEAISVARVVLDEYSEGPVIAFSNYSIVQDETKDRYLLVDNRKRKIEGDEAFRLLGFNPEEVELVRSGEIASYANAVPITSNAIYPQGALLKDQSSQEVYWVQNGFKYAVSSEVAGINYASVNPIPASAEEINNYYPGAAQKIKDGKVVKSDEGALYVVSRGELRPVESVSAFIELFGEERLAQATEVTDATLALHTTGALIENASYERNTGTVAGEKTPSATSVINYRVLWSDANVPATLVRGQETRLNVQFRNKSNARWEVGDVEIRIDEIGASAFNNDIVPNDLVHSFVVPVMISDASIDRLTFKLYTKDGTAIQGGLYQARVSIVEPEYQASIVSHSMPVAVSNKWDRVKVEVRVKNTGKKAWTRRKTGLQFLTGSGVAGSAFYDASDWVDSKTASVSLEPRQSTISPGEEAVFRFTLKTRGVAEGGQWYRMKLWMSDVGEPVYLDGREFFDGIVRVDG